MIVRHRWQEYITADSITSFWAGGDAFLKHEAAGHLWPC
jgi:hypothetical protein